MSSIFTDLRYSSRVFRRRPVLTAVVLVALAVGLGAVMAALTLVDAIILRKPPLPEPDRVVVGWEIDPKEPASHNGVSPADFNDWRDSGAFQSLAVWMKWNSNLAGIATPQRVSTALVSGSFFDVLRRPAKAGRTLAPSDAIKGAEDVVVISDRLWRDVFHGDQSVIGRRVKVDGESPTVVGVMPADFAYPTPQTDLWTSIVFGVQFQPDDRLGRNLHVMGRLRDGVSVQQASAILTSVMKRIAAVAPVTHQGWTSSLATIHEEEIGSVRPAVTMIFIAAVCTLLVAIANVVNLLLMLASSRARELATRLALGAAPKLVLRQAAIDGALLGVLAGAGGLTLSWIALSLMGRIGGTLLPAGEVIAITPRVAIAGMMISIVVGIAAAAGAMLIFRRRDLAAAIRQSHQVASSGSRMRSGMVVAQIAFTVALLIPAGILLESFQRLAAVDPGFTPQKLVAASVWLPRRYREPERQIAFFRDAITRLRALPGVEDVATIQDLPLRRNAMTFNIAIDGLASTRSRQASYRVVSDGYFGVMRIPLLRGRAFNIADDGRSQRVLIINEALASRAFGRSDPIGKRIRIGDDGPWATVVGVAGDVKQMGLAGEEVPAVYQPLSQKQFDFLRWNTLVIRMAAGGPADPGSSIRRTVMKIDPDQPVYDIQTVDAIVNDELARPRLAASVVSYLAGVALLVALIGIAGALSYASALRTREFGLRVALGASPKDIVTLVLGQAARLAVVGIVAGVLLAVSVSRVVQSMLFQVTVLDANVYAAVSLSVLAAAIVAGALPAVRASQADPVTSLRHV